MSRRRYVWRVTAYYPAPQPSVVRHYQSSSAAQHRAGLIVHGSPQSGYQPAERVTIERSAPVDGWSLIVFAS